MVISHSLQNNSLTTKPLQTTSPASTQQNSSLQTNQKKPRKHNPLSKERKKKKKKSKSPILPSHPPKKPSNILRLPPEKDTHKKTTHWQSCQNNPTHPTENKLLPSFVFGVFFVFSSEVNTFSSQESSLTQKNPCFFIEKKS